MKSLITPFFSALTLGMLTQAASAHTNYGGTVRDLGPAANSIPGTITGFSAGAPYFKSITNQTVTSNIGWVAGTEAAFGDAHLVKAYRFTLAEAGAVTITTSVAVRGSGTAGFLPGFSLYSGLLHTVGGSDYDTSLATQAYLATLGDPQPRRGAFDALATWKIGNDAGNLSTLTYVGNAADGTSANFGFAAGIEGDGNADGTVTGSWWLPAGDYSLFVGGADLSGTDTVGTYGIDVSLSVIPEPSSLILSGIAAAGLMARRRRN